jgi:gas vesicle protein
LQELRNDIKKLADSQIDMRPLLSRLQDLFKGGGFGLDDQSRQHLRNLDGQLGRLMEDVSRGRQESVQELRSEIKVLARTIAALADEGERR